MKKLIAWLMLIAPLACFATANEGLIQVAQAYAWILLIISVPIALIGIGKSADDDMADARAEAAKSNRIKRTIRTACNITIIALFAYHGMVVTAIAWAIQWGLIQLTNHVLREAHKKEQEGVTT